MKFLKKFKNFVNHFQINLLKSKQKSISISKIFAK